MTGADDSTPPDGRRGEITQLLARASEGAPAAIEQLFAAVYGELRRAADRQLRGERWNHTLQATELVHEAFLRLVDGSQCRLNDRVHFMAVAGQSMRRILVDHARRRGAQKRGGNWERMPLDEVLALGNEEAESMLVFLDQSLERLAGELPEMARLVELRHFAGLTHEECGELLGLSRSTIIRHLKYAESWLYRDMTTSSGPGTPT
ncbi:MAG: sigma-70 family RNA polymerase sigma factor [Candidatus Eisenbacteria bacterium]|nr:sigma-70 family RNA polymerase sigma factor [Candidatus Eisenbacteria bacterium]